MSSPEAPVERRSLKYIRLAAYLAGQPGEVEHLVLTIPEIEQIVGQDLPRMARFPSWWRNDERRTHSRAWLAAGWSVEEIFKSNESISFVRRSSSLPPT
jgi:hypothetical protein